MNHRGPFRALSMDDKAKLLYREGRFIMSIRYYGYKVNLYLFDDFFVEVFYNHKADRVEKIDLLDAGHSRMKFYLDQISLPDDLPVA